MGFLPRRIELSNCTSRSLCSVPARLLRNLPPPRSLLERHAPFSWTTPSCVEATTSNARDWRLVTDPEPFELPHDRQIHRYKRAGSFRRPQRSPTRGCTRPRSPGTSNPAHNPRRYGRRFVHPNDGRELCKRQWLRSGCLVGPRGRACRGETWTDPNPLVGCHMDVMGRDNLVLKKTWLADNRLGGTELQ